MNLLRPEGGTFIVPGHGRICDEFDAGLRSQIWRGDGAMDDGHVCRSRVPQSGAPKRHKIHKRLGPAGTIDL
jgi:hypothetical protein